ncbi:MAG: hypothetical protein PHY04_04070 [Candidatus ainarchaeum sp.]|jgi:hypothetical protein|nr:hypothetical protein [Candidatus ainarchaeum sp.]MDD4128885.1 hypothetical protein [Candidatus ainarchaeum sp.]
MKSLEFDVGEVLKLFESNKVFELRGLSSRVVREASLNNDYAKAELGVIAYALHKIESKQHFVKSPQWGRLKQSVKTDLRNAQIAIKQNNTKAFLESLKKVIQHITKIDSQLGNYAIGIYDKAKIKEASLAYSYGLSIAQSAQLTGADKKELQEYIGATTMHDEELETKNLSQRVKELKEILQGE